MQEKAKKYYLEIAARSEERRYGIKRNGVFQAISKFFSSMGRITQGGKS